jgi:hypothetical protein
MLVLEAVHLLGTFDTQMAMRRIQRLVWSLGGSYEAAGGRDMMLCVTVFGRGIVLPISVFETVSSMDVGGMTASLGEKRNGGEGGCGAGVMSWRVSLSLPGSCREKSTSVHE